MKFEDPSMQVPSETITWANLREVYRSMLVRTGANRIGMA